MKIVDYIKNAARTLVRLSPKTVTAKDLDNYHMAFGIGTEAGEIEDVFKKYLAYGKEIDWINVQEEIGDLMWYIAGFCTINNFDLDAIMENNIKKLRARYPEKFTQENATNRNLDREREILEELGYSTKK